MTPAPARRPWVWPWRPGRRLADTLDRWSGLAAPVMARRWWPAAAVAVGALPVLAGYAAGTPAHQPLTALLLAPLFWACVREDRFGPAVALVALAMGAHSAVTIALSALDPAGAAAVLPDAERYWGRTWHWVRTGRDAEYEWAVWLPAHLLLVVGVPALAYTSVGVIPFAAGLQQVDLMNYYVGQLIRASDRPALAVLLGWHPWSVLRGAAYTVLVYEAASLSLERLTGRPLSTRRRRLIRWGLGLGLAVADAAAKLLLAPVIRDGLAANLRPAG